LHYANEHLSSRAQLCSGLFGPKWTEKWVHLDGTLLKCFPMAVEQQVFSLGSSRRSSCFELMDYKFAVADEVATDCHICMLSQETQTNSLRCCRRK
jgi:hypothetical protein